MNNRQDANQRCDSKEAIDSGFCIDVIGRVLLDCDSTPTLLTALNMVLETLGSSLDAGQLNLTKSTDFNSGKRCLRIVTSWPKAHSKNNGNNSLVTEAMFLDVPSDWLKQLASGEVLQHPIGIPQIDSTDNLTAFENGSHVLVPLHSGSQLQGVLHVSSQDSNRSWTAAEINLLKQASQMMMLKLQSWQQRTEPKHRGLLQSMFEQAPQAFQVLDSKGHILEVNQAWLDQLDYPREEVIGTWFGNYIHANERELFRISFEKFLGQGGQHRTDTKLQRRDGSLLDISFCCQIATEPFTQEQLTYCTFLDITELKIVNETLAHSELIKSLVLDSIDEHVLYEDLNQNIIWANQAALEFAGMQTSKVLGKPCYLAMYGRNTPCSGCPISHVFTSKQPHRGEVQASDGTWWEVTGTPVFEPSNGHELCGVVKLSRNITERKQALKQLKENEARYRAVVEDQTELICRFAPDGAISFANEAVCRLFEMDPRNVIGSQLNDYLTPNDLRRFTIRLERITPKHPIQTFRVHSITPHGRDYWADWTIRAIYDQEDFLVEYQAVGRDVTTEQIARLQLAESRASLAEAQAIAHIGSWRWDLTTGDIYWSDETWRIFGLEPKKGPHRRGEFRQYVHPDDLPKMRDISDNAIVGLKPYDITYRIFRKDGQMRYIHSQGVVRKDSTGQPIKFNGIIHDITELHLAQQALIKSESKLKAMIDAVPDLLFVMDREGRYIELFAGNPNLLTIPSKQLIGRTMEDVLPMLVAQAGRAALAETFATGEVTTLEYSLDYPGGKHWFEARLSKYGDNEALAIIRDITGQVNAINAQREMESRFKQLFNQMLDPVYVHYCFLTEDRHNYFLEVNQAATELLGYSADEFKKLSPVDFDAGPRDIDLTPIVKNLQDGKPVIFERLHRAKSGELIPVEIHARPIEYQGEAAVVSVVRDMRPILEATEVLRQNEQRFREMFEKHSLPMLLIDPESNQILDANEAAQRMYGYQRNKFQSMNIAEINMLPPEEVALAVQEATNEVCGCFVFPHKLANGEIRTVEVNTAPIEVEGHKILFSIINDITEREQAIELLKASETKFQSLLTIVPIGIGLAVDRVMHWSNKAMLDMLGYTAEELCGKNVRMLYCTEEEFVTVGEQYRKVADSTDVHSHETRWMCKDGSVRNIVLTGIQLDPMTNTHGIIFTATDITDRKLAETEREQLISNLKNSITEIRTLSGLLPICANCKKIRNDAGYWQQIEGYIQQHSAAQFSHSICPDCIKKLYPELHDEVQEDDN